MTAPVRGHMISLDPAAFLPVSHFLLPLPFHHRHTLHRSLPVLACDLQNIPTGGDGLSIVFATSVKSDFCRNPSQAQPGPGKHSCGDARFEDYGMTSIHDDLPLPPITLWHQDKPTGIRLG